MSSAEPIELTQARWVKQRSEKIAGRDHAKFEILQLKEKIRILEENIVGWNKEIKEIEDIVEKNNKQFNLT